MAKGTIRVLLVEDSAHDAEIVRRMLGKYERVSFEFDWVRTTAECVDRLNGDAFDLVLLDYGLPDEDGLDFLRRLKDDGNVPPVIMLTGWGDARIAAEAMQCGAYDYFPKNAIDSEILAHAIHQALEKYRSEIEEKRLRDELQRLVITDELTGLYNRRYLAASLKNECRRALRYGRDLSCLMIDLDDFKRCNDANGHLFGDEVLKQVGALIRDSARDTDVVVRYGGDEFFVVLAETSHAGAMLVAERIRRALAAQPLTAGQRSVSITASIGVCTPSQKDDLEPIRILACADKALMAAKAAGNNRVWGHLSARAASA